MYGKYMDIIAKLMACSPHSRVECRLQLRNFMNFSVVPEPSERLLNKKKGDDGALKIRPL